MSVIPGLEIPEINELQSRMYNKALISWEWPGKRDTADTYVLEYHKLNKEEESAVWQEIEVSSKSKVIPELDNDSSYAFRVRGYKGSICSAWSREVILHTAPAPGIGFSYVHKVLNVSFGV